MKAAALAICAALAIAATPLASSASPAVGGWTATVDMATPRDNLTATPLENGRVLVVGGVGESTTELYDPPTGTWIPGGTLNQPRWLHEAVRLRDGRVLLAGSGDAGDVYSPATGTWAATGPRAHPLVGGAALAPLPDGQVLSAGGSRLANCSPKGCGSEPVASAELYGP